MMIDKRLINTVVDSKKWIARTVLWNWVALVASIVSAVIFALCLEEAFQQQLTMGNLISYAINLVLALIVHAFAGKMSVKASYYASTQVKHKLRTLIFNKLASMPLNQVNQQSTSSIIQVASEGVEQLEIYFGRYLPQLFYSLLAPFILFLFLVFFNVPTAVILLVCVPLIPMSIVAVNKIAKRLLHKYWAIYVGLGSSFLDNLQGLITLKIYQDDDYKAQQMDKEAETFRTITMKVLTMQLNSVSIMDLLASEFFIPLRLLGSFFHVAMNGKAASDKIFTLLDTPVESNDKTQSFDAQQEIQVDIENLHFSYSDEKPAINGLNLSIEPKKLTVFVGKSGCGKSTLVSLLMGFHKAQQGKILFNQQDIQEIERHFFYQQVSLVSHSYYIFKGSLRENMLMANLAATDEQIYSALEQVNLANFVRENGGLDMLLLSRGSNLSGGQIQRLALARALLHDAYFYIFDEATSNIDVESEEIILTFNA